MSVNRDRSVVYRYHLKNKITRYNENIIYSKQQYVYIDLEKIFSLYELNSTDRSKYHTDKYRYKSQPVRDCVYHQINARKIMKPNIYIGKSDVRSVLSDRTDINSLYEYRPDNKHKQSNYSCEQQLIFQTQHHPDINK